MVDVKSLKVFITTPFIQEFIDLFDSESAIEREYLKNILHKIYAKVQPQLNINLVGSKEEDDQESHKWNSIGPYIWDSQIQWGIRAFRHIRKHN